MSHDADVLLLPVREVCSCSDTELPLDKVDARHEFRHGMLDLKPRVHLQEPELAGIAEEELDRSQPLVADLLCKIAGTLEHVLADLRRERRAGTRALFEELLVPALHGALALAE